jgi:hypothetical protein
LTVVEVPECGEWLPDPDPELSARTSSAIAIAATTTTSTVLKGNRRRSGSPAACVSEARIPVAIPSVAGTPMTDVFSESSP